MIDNQLIELEMKSEGESFEYILTPQLPEPIKETELTFDKHFWIPLLLLLLILNLAFYLYKSLMNIG